MNSHLLKFPKGMLALRIIQGIIAVAAVGLSSYGVSIFVLNGIAIEVFTVCTLSSSVFLLLSTS